MNKLKIPENLKKEDILALDIATHCGYCAVNHNGTWDFTERAHNDYKEHLDFHDTITKAIKEWNIRLVTAEDVTVGTFFKSMRKLSEYRGVLLEVCDELDMPEPIFINCCTIKSFATGNGKSDKATMMAAMESRYGIKPCDDNACDAFWLYKLICSRYRL